MSKEEVKHHKTVRGAYRGHCNQDIKRAERLLADTEVFNSTELKAIAERLSRRLDEIKAMDSRILNALGTDEEISEETDQNDLRTALCHEIDSREKKSTYARKRRKLRR